MCKTTDGDNRHFTLAGGCGLSEARQAREAEVDVTKQVSLGRAREGERPGGHANRLAHTTRAVCRHTPHGPCTSEVICSPSSAVLAPLASLAGATLALCHRSRSRNTRPSLPWRSVAIALPRAWCCSCTRRPCKCGSLPDGSGAGSGAAAAACLTAGTPGFR